MVSKLWTARQRCKRRRGSRKVDPIDPVMLRSIRLSLHRLSLLRTPIRGSMFSASLPRPGSIVQSLRRRFAHHNHLAQLPSLACACYKLCHISQQAVKDMGAIGE